MKEITLTAMEMQPLLVSWRRQIHELAEVDMETQKTSAIVKKALEEMGYKAEYVAGTGVTALAGGKRPGKCFLLRADMDAIGGITEESGLEFRSINGAAHACGHDFHTAMLLGAAKLLKKYEKEIDGTVKFMFQPAEETLKGAKAMINAGILENPKVDAAAMIHMAVGKTLMSAIPSGKIVFLDGNMSSHDFFEISITGKAGHGAMPETTIDPLSVASHIHLALQSLTNCEISARDISIITVSQIQGGFNNSIIPDAAVLKGSIYAMRQETRKMIWERVKAVCTSMADAFRARAEVKIIEGAAPLINDPSVSLVLKKALIEEFGENEVIEMKSFGGREMISSEDFSFISCEIPSTAIYFSAGSPEEGYAYDVHHPKAIFNEGVLGRGAAIYALAALSWLKMNK